MQAASAQEELEAGAIDVNQKEMRWDLDADEWEKLTGQFCTMLSRAMTCGAPIIDGSKILSELSPSPRDIFTQWKLLPRNNQPTLIYRATRDGFSSNEFYRCCTGKSPFLLLLKFAHPSYVVGVYSAVSIPEPHGDAKDSTSTSFFFSLTNKGNRPYRFMLQPGKCAISRPPPEMLGYRGMAPGWNLVQGSLNFGSTACPALRLFHRSDMLNAHGGVYYGSFGPQNSYLPDNLGPIPLSASHLFGAQEFACSEVEVFEM